MKKYQLFLINPRLKYHHYGIQKELSILMGKTSYNFSLSLPLIAALTPDHYQIKIIDEDYQDIPEKPLPDIVGITTSTATITRVYEIADWYRAKNVTVILGGAYATFMPEEALRHADCVVSGEVEGVWANLLADFENSQLQKQYKADKPCNYSNAPIPRWDLVNTQKMNILGIQITRGCPYYCDFCITTEMFGHKQRYREIDNVIEEIKSLPLKRIFFLDDNLTFNKKYATELMKKIKPLNISFVCQSSIEIAFDDNLLTLMKEAGCLSILIGFESINQASLQETRKNHNQITDYTQAIHNIQKKGIYLIASFVIGFDHDRLTDLDKIARFVDDNNLLFAMINVLTAAPGTRLYSKMKEQGRLSAIAAECINGTIPHLQYNHMSQLELLDKYYQTLENIFSLDSMQKKILNLFAKGYYTDPTSESISTLDKIKGSLVILQRYYFSKDLKKKEFFKKLFVLGKDKTVAWDRIAYLLLAIEGFQEYLKSSKVFLPEIREIIRKVDKGPYNNGEQ